jgi:inhibitor of cysteine peptidase
MPNFKHLLLTLSLSLLFAACSPPTGTPPADSPAASDNKDVIIDDLQIQIMESFPVQVAVVVTGSLLDGCVVLDTIEYVHHDEMFTLTPESHREGDVCTEALVPFEERVVLDVEGLAAGTYQVVIGDVSADFTLDIDNILQEE